MRTVLLLLLLGSGTVTSSFAQLSLSNALQATGLPKAAPDGVKRVNDKALGGLGKKYEKLDAWVETQSQRMLVRLQKKEKKLKNELAKKDSLKAAQLFAGTEEQYKALRQKLAQPYD